MKLSVQKFLNAAEDNVIIDVRSPDEFMKGHIPHALNLYLFDDQERALIGTLYKQKSREIAVEKGLEIIGPRLAKISDSLKSLAINGTLSIHCWRGGMRSESVAWLAEISGLQVNLLIGGYKAYRAEVLSLFEKEYSFQILGGKTGSGKTEILHLLKKSGEQILDLEGLACHKGSIFGDLGQDKQPTPQLFENKIAYELSKFNPNQKIWVENESSSIGRAFVPKAIYDQMKCAPLLQISIPHDVRRKRIINEYGHFDAAFLLERILKIERRLGGAECKEAMEAIKESRIDDATEILMKYYDRTYTHSTSKRSPTVTKSLELTGNDPTKWAKSILNT